MAEKQDPTVVSRVVGITGTCCVDQFSRGGRIRRAEYHPALHLLQSAVDPDAYASFAFVASGGMGSSVAKTLKLDIPANPQPQTPALCSFPTEKAACASASVQATSCIVLL